MRLRAGVAMAIILAATTGATAKGLSHGWAAPPKPTGCEAFGPDYKKVEGSDTCIRIGGSLRFETSIVTGGGSFTPAAGRR